MRSSPALIGLALLSGCAWAPGEPVTTVRAVLEARLDPDGRAAGEGWYRLSSDYELSFDRLSLTPGDVSLQSLAAGSSGGAFDPENPPEGYACHGGHCHTPDGRDLTYEELAAELSGGGGGYQTLAQLRAPEGELNFLLGVESVPYACGDCALDHGTVTRVLGRLETLTVSGRVRDTRAAPRFPGERTFSFSLPAEDAPLGLSTALTLVSDRFSPYAFDLALSLTLTPALFDGADWAALEADSADHLPLDSEANHEVLDELLATLAASALRAEATPSAFDPY